MEFDFAIIICRGKGRLLENPDSANFDFVVFLFTVPVISFYEQKLAIAMRVLPILVSTIQF
jgi:hypothetical protein